MRDNRIAHRFAFGKHNKQVTPPALSSEDRLALSCFPIIKANEPCAAPTGVTDSDPLNPKRVQPSADLDRFVLWDYVKNRREIIA